MTGRGIAAIASNASRNDCSIARASSGPPNSEMSAPAANAFSPPVTTTAFTDASPATPVAASHSAASIARESAFIGGLFRRSVTTPSSLRSDNTRSAIAANLTQQLVRRVVGIALARGHRVDRLLERGAFTQRPDAFLHARPDERTQFLAQPCPPPRLGFARRLELRAIARGRVTQL